MTERIQKREHDGKYAFDGNLDRLCVCGHTLGRHGAGSPADCLYYSLSKAEREQAKINDEPGAHDDNCRCSRFRLSRKKQNQAV